MIDWLLAFSALLAALTVDRAIGSAVQLWGMRRMSRNVVRSLDSAVERREASMKADDAQRRRRVAN